MTDKIITAKTAKLAKDVGFITIVKHVYGSQTIPQLELYNDTKYRLYTLDYYLAPTQSLLQRWLREIHNIHIIIGVNANDDYYVSKLYNLKTKYESSIIGKETYYTYEEALELALQEALELIK